jgi:PAS domain S-box-containing protein
MEVMFSENVLGNLTVNENCYKMAFDEIDDGIIIVNKAGSIQLVNRAACLLLGYNKSEPINFPLEACYQSVPDTSVEALIHYCGRRKYQSEEILFPFRILTAKDGRIIQTEEKMSVLFDSANEPIGKLIQFRSMEKVRDAEIKSYSGKEFYLSVIENLPYLICRVNTEGQFNYFNRCWLEFTGRSINKEIYMGWLSYAHPEDKPVFEEMLNDAIVKRESAKMELRLLNREGEYRWLLCMLNPFNDAEDKFSGYLCLFVDITDRKLMENELLKAKELSEVSDKAKSTFLSNMSHEIRTPLNSIMGLTDVLYDTKLDAEQIEFLNIIKHSSQTLLGLLNNLLESSRLDEGKAIINESVFNFSDCIENIFKLFRFQAQESKLYFTYEINRNIPIQLVGDFQKLKCILINLVMNAIKFTEKGFVKLQVFLENMQGSGKSSEGSICLHFKITDSGIGIPKDKQEAIFESFTQVDGSSTRRYSGAGLGLSIVKRLTKLMNGRVWLESNLGKGSCFHVILYFRTAGTIS